MKFNLNWLKDYLKTDCTAQEVCEKLNSIGLEVETTLPKVEVFDKIVVDNFEILPFILKEIVIIYQKIQKFFN